MKLKKIKNLKWFHGVPFPGNRKFRQFIIAGPPGSGKSTLISKIHGWPLEGYIDLTRKAWWRDQSLTYRPREVHLGFPFKGQKDSLTVFDKPWLENWQKMELELERIQIPPAKRWFFSIDWRNRFIIEFLLPPAEKAIVWRGKRDENPAFPTEKGLTQEMIQRQNELHLETALYLQRQGMSVYVREGYNQRPKSIHEE